MNFFPPAFLKLMNAIQSKTFFQVFIRGLLSTNLLPIWCSKMPDDSIQEFLLYNSVFPYELKSGLEDFGMKQNGYLQSILEIWVKLCFGL